MQSSSFSNALLLVLVFSTVFVVPLLPASQHGLLYDTCYAGIYFLAALAVQRHRRMLLTLALSLVIVERLSDLLDLPLLTAMAGAGNILFFILIVVLLIAQIARTKEVSARLIVESINGYLLIGLTFALLVILLATHQPEAYSFTGSATPAAGAELSHSDCFYYAFVTFTTVGYGDLLPEISKSKSLATLMSMTGQLYLAVILATLVGKFASRPRSAED